MTMLATRGAVRRALLSLSGLLTLGLTLGLTGCEPPTPPHPDPDPEPGQRLSPPLDPFESDELAYEEPCACDDAEVSPVCGDDGITYSSTCAAACSGAEVIDEGACDLLLDCDSDADCDPLDYCRRDGACGGPGACVPRPDVCDVKGQEACGCDGETYPNSCVAAVIGVSVAHPGACGCMCELIYDPVCGDDGETYANTCLAECAGAAVEHGGSCSGYCSFNVDCGEDEFCDHGPACDTGRADGECVPKPTSCLDDEVEACGCDGETYSSACEANAAGVSVATEGTCEVLTADEA